MSSKDAIARQPGPQLVSWFVDLCIVAIFVALICSPLITEGASVSEAPFLSDLLKLAQPALSWTGERLRNGELPLWNPYWSGGYPNLAMAHSSVFYPTTILYGLLPFPTAINIIVLLHIYLASAFSYCLGRRTVGGRLPGLYLAIAMVAGDLMLPTVLPGHPWSLQTLAWFPLVLLFAHNSCARVRLANIVGIALASALMHLGGDPQSASFALFFVGAFIAAKFVLDLASRTIALTQALARGSAVLIAMLLGAGLAAIQLVPSQELLAESVRGDGISYAAFSGFIGSRTDLLRAWVTDARTAGVMATARLSIVAAIIGLIFSHSRTAVATSLAMLPCLIYAFAPEPLFDAVIRHLPVFGSVRGATRMVIMAYWGIAFLGAFGVRAWADATSHPKARNDAMMLTALALSVAGAIIPSLLGEPLPAPRLGILAICSGALLWALLDRRRPKIVLAAGAVLALALVSELRYKANELHVFEDTARHAVNADFAKFASEKTDLDRVEVFGSRQTNPRLSAIGTVTKTRTLWGYHALYLTRFARLLDEVGGLNLAPRDAAGRMVSTNEVKPGWLTSELLPLLDLFNMRYLIRLDKELVFKNLSPADARRFIRVDTDTGAVVYKNLSALPPVFAVHRVTLCETDDEAIALMRGGNFDYRNEITVTGTFDTRDLAPASGPETVTIDDYSPERIVATVSLSAPAVLVFSEMYYPGWEAYVDGESRDVLIVDTAFRGVRVDEGQHIVDMRYRPASLRVGAFLSATSFMILIAMTGIAAKRLQRPVTPA